MPKTKIDLNPTNFYEVMDKKFLDKHINPHYNIHKIQIPFRMAVVGGSGAMKTNTALNVIKVIPDTFHRIVIVTKNKDEPLYNYLKDKVKDVEMYEGISQIPDLDTFDKKKNSLVIFDDLVLDKNQEKIQQFYIRCRKLGVSVMYLSQCWYKIPIAIRQNLTYIVLKKIAQTSDLNRVLKDYSIGINKYELHALYKYAIEGKNDKDKTNFMMIDIEADDNTKFRKNFTAINFTVE